MKVQRYRIESFEWARIPEDLPRENLVLAVTKTSDPTIHPSDVEYPIRLFRAEELHDAARSLAKRYVGLNHLRLPDGSPLLIEFSPEEIQKVGFRYAFTVDANYNAETKCVEALLCLPRIWVQKIKRGLIHQVSVEYTWRDENKKAEGVEFLGLIFDKVDLLENLNAGDHNTVLRCVESNEKKGEMEGELAVPRCKECPLKDKECNGCKTESGETDIKQDMISDSIEDESLTFFKECEEAADQYLKRLGEPLHSDFQKIHDAMVSKYGPEKGKQVFYAWVNKHSYDDTKAIPKKKKETVGQIPEQPVNIMANEPTPMSAIYPEKLSDKPNGQVTSVGAVADREPETESKGEVIIVTDEDKSKQRVESVDQTDKDKKKDDKKKESLPPIPSTPPVIPPVDAPPIIPELVTAPAANVAVAQPTVMTPETQNLIESQAAKLVEQDKALVQLQKTVKASEESKAKAVAEAKEQLINKIESVLPDNTIISGFSKGGQRLAEEIRKVVYEEKQKE
jgi:hypothetical protein